MTNQDDPSHVALASEINVLLGVWLVISPWFHSAPPASASVTWNNVIVGILIMTCSAQRIFSPQKTVALSGVNILLGIWTVVSPWIYGYTTDAPRLGTNIIVGSLVIGLALWSGCTTYLDHRQHRHA